MVFRRIQLYCSAEAAYLSPPGALTGLLLQDYMQGAGEEGVLLVALGTVTELGEARPLLLHMLI